MHRVVDDLQLDYSDVVICPRPSEGIRSRKDVNIIRSIKHNIFSGIPIINANMSTTATFDVANAMLEYGMFATLHKHYTAEEVASYLEFLPENQRSRIFITIGMRETSLNIDDLQKIRTYLNSVGKFPGHVLLDVPNGYLESVNDLTKKIRELMNKDGLGGLLMVGNVCDGGTTTDLCFAGADIVKVGIAPGSKCRTRDVTGVARPQFSAVYECALAAHSQGKFICADGGIQTTGDVSKALGAGADLVMCGFLYAGTEEADGEVVEKIIKTNEYEIDYEWDSLSQTLFPQIGKPKLITKKYKEYYGMASKKAQDKFYNGIPDYKTAEGATGLVEYTGTVKEMNDKICGAIRSAMTYTGAKNLEEFGKCCQFYRVNNPHISRLEK